MYSLFNLLFFRHHNVSSSILHVTTAIAIPIVQNLRIDNEVLMWSRIEDYDIQIQSYQVEVR